MKDPKPKLMPRRLYDWLELRAKKARYFRSYRRAGLSKAEAKARWERQQAKNRATFQGWDALVEHERRRRANELKRRQERREVAR